MVHLSFIQEVYTCQELAEIRNFFWPYILNFAIWAVLASLFIYTLVDYIIIIIQFSLKNVKYGEKKARQRDVMRSESRFGSRITSHHASPIRNKTTEEKNWYRMEMAWGDLFIVANWWFSFPRARNTSKNTKTVAKRSRVYNFGGSRKKVNRVEFLGKNWKLIRLTI